MARGKGVRLQKYKDGGVSDVKMFAAADGLSWTTSGRTFTKPMAEMRDWVGERAQAGRQPPNGFPKNNDSGVGRGMTVIAARHSMAMISASKLQAVTDAPGREPNMTTQRRDMRSRPCLGSASSSPTIWKI